MAGRRHAQELSRNTALRAGLKAFSAAGGVVYAECGGLIFLSRAVQPEEHGGDFPMGALACGFVVKGGQSLDPWVSRIGTLTHTLGTGLPGPGDPSSPTPFSLPSVLQWACLGSRRCSRTA